MSIFLIRLPFLIRCFRFQISKRDFNRLFLLNQTKFISVAKLNRNMLIKNVIDYIFNIR
ncbi:Uncharacterized protein dnm_097840 [Desulfonema magnum]|uniref:Uncharacterized protein n=1 Tax=Desulfonema magnum TaxID=45655 RepID=A0A975BY01_9BACT|nr:Uncharacterized protein dnm_097840 [Desulfonema magnum]